MTDFTYDNSFYFAPAPVPAWGPDAQVAVTEEARPSTPALLPELLSLVLTALSYPFPELLRWARS